MNSPSSSDDPRAAGQPDAGGIPASEVSQTDLILNLGNPDAKADAPAKHIDPRWQQQYQGLRDFRDYLLDQLSGLQSEARDVQIDPLQDPNAESATSDLLRDYLLGMTSTDQDTLIEVDAAIERIELGTYGVCERTGQPIPAERLKAVPWTRYTVDEQASVEAHDEAPIHASIGTRAGIGASASQAAPPDLPSPVTEPGREVGGPAPEGTEKAHLGHDS